MSADTPKDQVSREWPEAFAKNTPTGWIVYTAPDGVALTHPEKTPHDAWKNASEFIGE